MAVIKEFKGANFNFDEATASGTVLVDFWAPWCSYCKVVALSLAQAAQELPENAVIVKVNVDENPELAARHNITTLPTLIVYRNGQETGRYGLLSKSRIVSLFQ